MVFIGGRALQVFIGADLQDWSASVLTCELQRESLSQSGLLTLTGSITIADISTNPESIDPIDNPTRWRPGQPVQINIRNDANSGWITLANLFILDEPEFPLPGESISVELGCRLAWHDSFDFDDDQTGVSIGTPTNCSTVASRLLQAGEIASGNITLGTWPYALTFPDGKGPADSFVQQAGELAYANNYRYLYCNNAGTVVDGALSLEPASPTITVTLGTNEVDYRPIKVDGNPPTLVRVTAQGFNAQAQTPPIVSTETTYGDLTPYGGTGTGPISQTVTRINWYTTDGGNTMIRETTITESEIFTTTVITRPYDDLSNTTTYLPRTLIPTKIATNKKKYDLTRNGILFEETDEEQGYLWGVAPSAYTFTFYTDRKDTITYTYEQELLSVQTTTRERPKIAVGITIVITYWIETVIKTQWKEITTSRWQLTVRELFPKQWGESIADINEDELTVKTTVSIGAPGEFQPPATDYWDGSITSEDIEYRSEAEYQHPGGVLGRKKNLLISTRYGFSLAQCQLLASKEVQLIGGRHRAATIEMPISDALLTAPPLFPCTVVMPDGSKRHYAIDGLTYAFEGEQCTAVGVGILTGRTAAPTVEVPDPPPITEIIPTPAILGALSSPMPTLATVVLGMVNAQYAATVGGIVFGATIEPAPIEVTHGVTVSGIAFAASADVIDNATHAVTVGGVTFAANVSTGIAASHGVTVSGLVFAAEGSPVVDATHGVTVSGLVFAAQSSPVVEATHGATVSGLVFAASAELPWTPANITTTLWLKEEGTDSSWTDHSGNDYHATQATESARPSIANTLNGLTVRTFDGSNDYLETPSLPLNTPTSLFVVFRTETLSGDRALINQQYGDESRPWQHYFSPTGRLFEWRSGAYIPSITAENYFILSEVQSSTAVGGIMMWRDGNAGIASVTANSYADSKAMSIGRAQTFGSIGWMQGRIAEVVLVGSAVDTATRQKVEGYLAHKWGLTANLPADHPYKVSPPTV